MDNLPDLNDIPGYGALLRDSQSFNANLCSSDKVYDGKNTGYHSSDLRWKRFAANEIYASNDLMPFPEAVSDACYRSFLHNLSKDPAKVYDSSAGYAHLSEVCLPEGEHNSHGADLVTRHEKSLSWKRFAESCEEVVQQTEKSDKELPFTLQRNEEVQNMNAGLNKEPNLQFNVQESIHDNHGSVAEPETDLHESCCLSPDYSLKLNSYGKESYFNSLISYSEENVEDGCISQCITSTSRDTMTHSSYFKIPDQGVYKTCNAACEHSNKDESRITVFETPDRNLYKEEFVNYGSMVNASLLPDEVDLFVVPGYSDELCLSKSPNSALSRRISIHMKGLTPNCMSDSPLCPPYSVLSLSHSMQLKPAWNTESSKVHEVNTTEGKCEVHDQCTYEIMCPCSSPAVSYRKQKHIKQNLDLKYQSLISSSEHNFSRCLLENLKQTPYVKSPDKHCNDVPVDSANEEELDCMFNRQLQTPMRKLMYRNQCLNSVTVANASFDSPATEDSLSNFNDPGSSSNIVRHSSPSGALPKSISVRLKGLSPKVKTVFPLCSGIATGRGGKKINEQVCEIYEQGTYKTELCNKWESMNSNCPYGQNCRFAHGLEELRIVARHSKYKTQVCRMVSAGEECRYGHRCHFRHALKEEE